MPNDVLLARIDENVKYLRESFDEHKEAFDAHVNKDAEIVKEFIRPLWEESQQRRGMSTFNRVSAVIFGFFVTTGISAVTAWAAVKALAAGK